MTDERIIAYLLDELPAEERERFEDECFAEAEWPEQITVVEDDLIEAYLRNQLTLDQRRDFEQNYLVTEARQERVWVAAALLRCLAERNALTDPRPESVTPPQNWTERFRAFWGGTSWAALVAAAVTVVILIAVAIWLVSPRPVRIVATLTLSLSQSNRADGGEVDKVRLPPNAKALRVRLVLPELSPQAARYRVELENADGEQRPVDVADQDAQSVRVVIPAAQLARGQYALKLFAVRSDGSEQRINGSYFFDVE